jgi:hypothetical protein
MEDPHLLGHSEKQYVDTSEDALLLVSRKYQNVKKQGRDDYFCFTSGLNYVAEVWRCSEKPGWWLRIREPK